MKIGFYKHFRKGAAAAALAVAAAAVLGCGDRAEIYYGEAQRYAGVYDYERAAARYELVATGFKHSALAPEARAGLERCRAEMHFDRAEELVYSGATYTALSEIAAGRRFAPASPRALYLAGFAHLAIGPQDVALQEFNTCVLRYPENPYGYLGRAEFFRFAQVRDRAFADYLRAYRAAGSDVRVRGAAFRGIRDMGRKLGNPDAAFSPYLKEGAAIVPADALNYWIGYYYLRKPPIVYGDALIYFHAALKKKGARVYKTRARAGLAECYFFYKDYYRAKAFIDWAIQADPENDDYYKTAERIYRKLGLAPPVKVQK